MKDIELKFKVQGEPTLDNQTKANIEMQYQPVDIIRRKKIWNNSLPPREKVSIDISGNYICFQDDWECTIFGDSYVSCISTLCTVHGFLQNNLGKKVTFEILSPTGEEGTVDQLIAKERRRTVRDKILIFILGVVVTILLTNLINCLLD